MEVSSTGIEGLGLSHIAETGAVLNATRQIDDVPRKTSDTKTSDAMSRATAQESQISSVVASHVASSHGILSQSAFTHGEISHSTSRESLQQAWAPSIARLWRLEAQRRFEHLRDKILGTAPESVLDLPIANWVTSTDRGLPMALLGRSLGLMLRRPFDHLCATPSIGVKKITALLELLARASNEVLGGPAPRPVASPRAAALAVRSHEAVLPGLSEAQWQVWRQRLRGHELSREPLGRLVSSLRDLPRNMWRTPLSTYCDLTLSQLHDLPIHGKKRMRDFADVPDA